MHSSESTVIQVLEEYNIQRPSIGELRRKYDIVEDYFENIDTPNKAYILGLFYADGTVSKDGRQIAISLQERDKSILDALNHEFAGDRKLVFIPYNDKNPNWQNQYCLSISNKKFNADLRSHGVVPNKSLVLEFPKNIPDKLISHFVRGYFDGDGNLSKSEDRCTLISTNSFCIELSKIIKDKLDVNSSILLCHGKQDKPTRTFQIAGRR